MCGENVTFMTDIEMDQWNQRTPILYKFRYRPFFLPVFLAWPTFRVCLDLKVSQRLCRFYSVCL